MWKNGAGLYVGVDLGLSGGIAVLSERLKVVEFRKLQTVQNPTRSSLVRELREVIDDHGIEFLRFAVEKPAQVFGGGKNRGTNAAALSGLWREWGACLALFDMFEATFTEVAAVSWQSRFWKSAAIKTEGMSTKDAARRVAGKLWPDCSFRIGGSSVVCDGAVDAALIALYAAKFVFREEV